MTTKVYPKLSEPLGPFNLFTGSRNIPWAY